MDDPNGRCSQCNMTIKKSQMGGHRYYYLSFGSPEGDKHKGSYFVGPATTPAATSPVVTFTPNAGSVNQSADTGSIPKVVYKREIGDTGDGYDYYFGGKKYETYILANSARNTALALNTAQKSRIGYANVTANLDDYGFSTPPAIVRSDSSYEFGGATYSTYSAAQGARKAIIDSRISTAQSHKNGANLKPAGPDFSPTGDLDGDGILNSGDTYWGPGATAPVTPPTQPRPTPAATAPAPTQQEQEASFYTAATKALDAAKAGDPQPLRNFDNFFGITRPEIEYTQAFYAPPGFNEQRYLATFGDQDPSVGPHNRIPFVRGVRGVQDPLSDVTTSSPEEPIGWSESQYLAANPDVAAAVANGEMPSGLAHYYSSGQAEGRQSDFSEPTSPTTPEVPANVPGNVVQPDSAEAGTTQPGDTSETTPEGATEFPEPAQDSSSAQSESEQEQENSEQTAAQAQQEEEKEAALATATAVKHSAKESRMKKLMSMRKPWSSGGSSSNGSDSMVAPPITPSSQIPPPPL